MAETSRHQRRRAHNTAADRRRKWRAASARRGSDDRRRGAALSNGEDSVIKIILSHQRLRLYQLKPASKPSNAKRRASGEMAAQFLGTAARP